MEREMKVRQVVTTGINTKRSVFYKRLQQLKNVIKNLCFFFQGPRCAKLCTKQCKKCKMGEHTGPTSTAACDPMEERDTYVSHARVNEEGSVGNGPGER